MQLVVNAARRPNRTLASRGSESNGHPASSFAAFSTDQIRETWGDAVLPMGARFASHDPKAARGNMDGYAFGTFRRNQIEENVRSEADASYGRAKRRIIYMGGNALRGYVFINDTVLRTAIKSRVAG